VSAVSLTTNNGVAGKTKTRVRLDEREQENCKRMGEITTFRQDRKVMHMMC